MPRKQKRKTPDAADRIAAFVHCVYPREVANRECGNAPLYLAQKIRRAIKRAVKEAQDAADWRAAN